MENNKTINNKTMKKIILTLLACSLFTSTFFAQTNENYGFQSLLTPQLGQYNAAFGKKALMQNSGIGNSAVGYQAMIFKTTGDYNTAVGGFTLTSPNTKSQNTAIGYKSQQVASGYSNTSLGFHTLRLASGNENIAVGNHAMKYTTTGSKNTLIGVGASEYSTTASNNTGVGHQSLFNLTTGEANVALGKNAGVLITTGSRNTIVGPYTTGSAASSYNIVMGYRSAATTGDNNIIIGKKITLPAGTSNAMNIGGVLFGTGFQSALPTNATAGVANGRIGINVVNPTAALDVNGNVSFQNSSLSMTRSSNEGPQIDLINTSKTAVNQAYRWSLYNMTGAYGNSLQFWNYTQTSCTSGGMCTPRFTIMDNGNVGIATTNPSQALSVVGKIAIAPSGIGSDEGYNGNLMITKPKESGQYINLVRQGSIPWSIGTVYNDNTFAIGLGVANDATFTTPFLSINTSGSIGIGTTTTGTHKLAVEGTIGAREIKVEAGTWSDFVFEDGYKLPSLTEVEQHIKEKGHLQDIPSTQEVTQSGINLGEMDAKLLQKIEELMLYTIAQNKEVEALKQIVKLQDEKLQKLEALR